MDLLLTVDPDIQQDAFFSVADLFNIEVDLLYFDTTSTCFEIEEEDDFRKKGLSKDHRPDLPQAVIGLAVTGDGIPVRVFHLVSHPTYGRHLRIEDRIRAYILLCWLALLLIRAAERETGGTWPKMRITCSSCTLENSRAKAVRFCKLQS